MNWITKQKAISKMKKGARSQHYLDTTNVYLAIGNEYDYHLKTVKNMSEWLENKNFSDEEMEEIMDYFKSGWKL